MMFTDQNGALSKDAYDFLFTLFQRVGGSLDSLNAVSLQDKTWQEPGTIGSITPNTGKFTTLTSAAYSTTGPVNFSPAGYNITLSPTSGGVLTMRSDNSGTLDNVAIGGTTPHTGKFTNLSATGTFACNNAIPQMSVYVPTVVTTAATSTTPYGYVTAAQANDIVTKLNTIITALQNNGILKSTP
jgi:hypothetical protein